ncbi:golgin subfamily A member 4-like isoform X15 [Portunus trituberculatus]|uniref:golgin subfamily A member 4-like isoform X15 n=1 Tax=Portunus trituberculatus TaxID=210409 RepID=UPI001E1CFE06|nr:golgin subfamily A member 4-like isoform X15 [Portunus trituberculatus]
MFKKLREKITEEVQHTSLRLPASVQQSVQQLTQTSTTDQWLETVKEGNQLSLSPFSGAAASPGEHKRELAAPAPLQDELLVDISDIRPAGHNKDLFSIDEDSHEGSPSKSGFQLVDLSDAEAITSSEGDGSNGNNQGVAGVTFDPSMSVTTSPTLRTRRDSASSSVSDVSGLFPIYEVPGVSFNMPQSDLESSSEWEEGGSAAVVERLSKDTVYQAYLKMRQRYHKYKGRYAMWLFVCWYADLARAYKDKEKESDKLRDVLAKTQDKALRKVTILQESVSGDLANPAVSHNNNNNNNNNNQQQVASGGLTLQDEGDTTSACDNSSSTDNTSTAESVSTTDNISMADNVSVASHGSASTTVTASHEAEELIEKLKASVEVEENGDSPDVSKHKSLLARCMDNIRTNKERIGVLMQERDIATSQLQEKIKQIDILKEDHLKELDSLRASMESSALSMAETKKQLFEELQVKEAEAERCKKGAAALETQLEEERSQWQEQLQNKQQELEEKEAMIQELGTNNTTQEDQEEDTEASVAAIKKEVEAKINELETRTQELKESRTDLESQLLQISDVKAQLEDRVLSLNKDKEEMSRNVEAMVYEKGELEEKLRTAEMVREELENKVLDVENVHASLKEEMEKLSKCNVQLEEKIKASAESQQEFEKEMEDLRKVNSENVNQISAFSGEITSLKEVNEKLSNTIELSQKENTSLKRNLEEIEKEKENICKEVEDLRKTNLEYINQTTLVSEDIKVLKEVNEKLANSLDLSQKENMKLKTSLEEIQIEKDAIFKDVMEKHKTIASLKERSAELDEKLQYVFKENSSLTEEIARTKSEKELLNKQINESMADADREKDSLSEELDHLKQENERINNEFNQTKLEKEIENKRLAVLEKENEELKSEKERLNLELAQSKASISKVSEQAMTEITLANEKMDRLKDEWARQMKEKDTINSELIQKLSDLNEKLVQKASEHELKTKECSQKSDEYNEKLKTLQSQLQEKEEKIQECTLQLSVLDQENKRLKVLSEKDRNELQTKGKEIESECSSLRKEKSELSARVEELEAIVDSHEVELTAVREDKRKYTAQLETVTGEKKELQDELQTLENEIVQLKKEVADKEGDIQSLKKETTQSQEEYAKVREEMAKLTETFEVEMNKAKESYTKLKDNFHEISKEKEDNLAHQNEQNSELQAKLMELKQQLQEMQNMLKQKNEKIENLLNEKKIMLSELEKRVEDLQDELKEKETLLKAKADEYDSRTEELEAQMSASEDDLRKKLEDSFQEKHKLEQQLGDLQHKLSEKDELAVRQAEVAEQKLTQVQQSFATEREDLENTWEQKLRNQGIADSLSANCRYVALLNMIKISCELDQLKKHHEEALASRESEVTRSHQAELEGVQSSYQHSVASRDATIAALKDEADQQRLAHQDDLEAWQRKYQDLESQLAEAKCQIERLQGFEACLEEARTQLAAAAAKRLKLEEKLAAGTGTSAPLKTEIEQLQQHNKQLKDTLEHYQKEKEETNKRIAALESSNDDSKNKVMDMELSQKNLQENINRLSQEKERLFHEIQEGSSEGMINVLIKEKEELAERLTKEKEAQMKEYQGRNKALQEKVEGLEDIRHGYEKQISQIEASNAEMHSKIGSVQQEYDAAKSETHQILAQKRDIEERFKENLKIKEALQEEITVHKGNINSMKEELEAEKNKVQTMVETISTLQNNILNLQKQIEGLNEMCSKLACDLEAESKLRVEAQAQLTQVQQLNKQLQEHFGVGDIMLCQLKVEQDKLQASMSSLSEGCSTSATTELYSHATKSDSDEQTPLVDRTDSSGDGNVAAEQLAEKTPTNVEQRIKVDEVRRLKAVLGARDEDLSRTRQTIKDLQDRLRIAEVVSGEVEEYRRRVREIEAKLSEMEEQHRQQVEAAAQEAERRVAAKEQECLNTISTAYDQQDSETTALVRQHQEALREAQQEVKEKAVKLDTMSQDYIYKLKEKDDELCKFVQQYEEQLAKMKAQNEVHVKEIEATWKSRAEKMVKQREGEMQQEMNGLKQDWTKERRSPEPDPAESPKELERLTQVAAAAFQSGTESVELLKKQVAAQRRELEDVKHNHGKEVGELKALLELKRRARASSGSSGVRLGVSLEEAAEFEYLKNVLYQYMLGKETQTLSKVLCAVVKFDGRQQQEILEHEEQRQSMLRSVNGSVHPSLLQEGKSAVSKAL